MNAGWREFLESIGGRVQDGQDVEFTTPGTDANNPGKEGFLIDLSHLSIIEIDGADAAGFLDGQFSSDIKSLTPDTFQFSAWCNPGGRVIAVFIIYRRENSHYILIPSDMPRYSSSVPTLTTKWPACRPVVIHDRSAELACLGIIVHGNLQEPPLTPVKSGHTVHHQSLSMLGIADGVPARLLTVGEPAGLIQLCRSWENNFVFTGSGHWISRDISAGIPLISSETSESFLPQELNLDNLNGLSFSKGCFPGQEVIARVHHRGKVKQRLFHAGMPKGTQVPGPGDRLYATDLETPVGTVINVAGSVSGDTCILAVVHTGMAGMELYTAGGTGNPLRFHAC